VARPAVKDANVNNSDVARFAGLPENAIQQFFADTAGVYVPKLPYMRSWLQYFEDTFLEGVEDAAWYFIIPGLGPLIAKGFAKAAVGSETLGKDAAKLDVIKAIGTPLHQLESELAKLPATKARRLLGAKAGTLAASAALMCGAEYLVQHNKNWLTAKLFNTKNFTAVAGLEKPTSAVDEGEQDPASKAKRRNVQVLAGLGTALVGSVALAKGVGSSQQAFKAAKKVMKWVDFAPGFDISKSLLALGVGTGVVSYLDAARNKLERKELASRLALVVPYLLFGKELAGNTVAWLTERNVTVEDTSGKSVALHQLKDAQGKPFTFLKPDFKLGKTPFQAKTFLDFNAVKRSVYEEVAQLPITAPAKEQILTAFNSIGHNKFLLCTAVMSAWLALLINAQTRARFNRDQQAKRPFEPSSKLPAKLYGASNTTSGTFRHFVQNNSLATTA
jgi:hypothetical protein